MAKPKKKKVNLIEQELTKATGVEKSEGQDDQTYYLNLIKAVNDLPDADWDKLSEEAQDWVNNGVDCAEANELIDDFPVLPEVIVEGSADVPDEPETGPQEEAGSAVGEVVEGGSEEAVGDPEASDKSTEDGQDSVKVSKAASKKKANKKPSADIDISETEAFEAALENEVTKINKRINQQKTAHNKAKGKEHRHAKPKVAKKRNQIRARSGTTRIKEILIERGLDLAADELYFQIKNEGYEYSRGTVDVIRSDFRNSCRVLISKGLLKNMETAS